MTQIELEKQKIVPKYLRDYKKKRSEDVKSLNYEDLLRQRRINNANQAISEVIKAPINQETDLFNTR